jgi:hypothetical protein
MHTKEKGFHMRKKLYPRKTKKQNSDCPNCGFEIRAKYSFESVLAGGFSNPDNGAYDAIRKTPVRQASLEADVLVPAAQSLVGAVVTTLPAIIVAQLARWEWYSPLAIGACTILVQWFSIVKKLESERSIVEEFSYTPSEEIERPLAQGNPQEPVRLEVVSKDDNYGVAFKIVDLPQSVSGREFVGLCQGVLAGRSLARKNWVGEGKQFSRDQYDDLISAMMTAGLINAIPGKGKKLTLGGKHAIRRMIREGGNDME